MPFSGGGSGGGGGGGNVVVTGPVDGSGFVNVDLQTALPAGGNAIGTVGVTALPALPAGANAIGTVAVTALPSIPAGAAAIGTVGVTALPALPTGSNVIGGVTQSGTWNVGTITTLPALPTGGNVIGAVTQSGTWNVGTITTLPALPTGGNTIGNVGQAGAPWSGTTPNAFVRLSSNFTRPANTTAYTAGDLVANSTTAGSVTPLSFANAARVAGDCFRVERVRLLASSTSLTTASFIVHFFESSPTVSVGDNAAFDSAGALSTTGSAVYCGNVPVTLTTAGSDGAAGIGTPGVGVGITMAPQSGTTVYALIEANSAYTPTSGETFTVIVEGYRP